ncbi:hypothetical protein CEP54_002462 [Fusarium duplospermum]|uniref:Uncharacterized protein n=1 Tax=Fusarium duplospermum TaxID=1325734 RepID=A0A428QUT7_9HYPO|nr:hypothetical protein CEP54_002462 [Fusarium duplospermum]
MVIVEAYDLTSIEPVTRSDHSEPWARIEGDGKEESLTLEMLEKFSKAVFRRWDSTNGAPNTPKDQTPRKKREMSVKIGTWANDASESVVSEKQRKGEGKGESEVKETNARKLSANA